MERARSTTYHHHSSQLIHVTLITESCVCVCVATECHTGRVHGQFPLQDLMVEEAESPTSFTVYADNRCFVVAAPSEWQRDRWLEDISRAILAAKTTLPSVSALASNASAFLGLEASISSVAGTVDNTEDEESKSDRSGGKFEARSVCRLRGDSNALLRFKHWCAMGCGVGGDDGCGGDDERNARRPFISIEGG
ncbi:unnamed protein product [Hydatigera taeniaeformis]|uniref:PH domain-containing protein n=1 Tax=Hydatigena taeniaeformis TaxID=6205 RepID=A0A0R3WQF7_HYDTA|nr:unnamed protein product [Hydatigera taeniaeformis]